MKIVLLNANDLLGGGSSVSTFRLYLFLQQLGHDSKLLVKEKQSDDFNVHEISTNADIFQNAISQEVYAYRNRTEISNTHFSLPLVSMDLTNHPLIKDADIIHLHWVESFLTAHAVSLFFTLDKPILWTLHDFGPLTGGCHAPAGCENFKSVCLECPQLAVDPFEVTARVFQDKKNYWADKNFHLIAPTEFIAIQARSSPLFQEASIHVIPNGVDTETFKLQDSIVARKHLKIPIDKKYILCGADETNLKLKGFQTLNKILKICFSLPNFNSLNLTILWVGGALPEPWDNQIPVINLGKLTESEMALAYSAANLFVLPSLEDNLPNMMLESISCGTPVFAFKVGGVPEVIKEGVHGFLFELNDLNNFALKLCETINDITYLQNMRDACRKLAVSTYDLTIVGKKYVALYEKFLREYKPCTSSNEIATPETFKQIQPQLVEHCLTEEILFLRQQLKANENNSAKWLNERLALIEKLQSICEERQAAIEMYETVCIERLSLVENLQNICKERKDLIEQQEKFSREHLMLIQELKKECDARQEVIMQLDEALKVKISFRILLRKFKNYFFKVLT